MGKLPGVPHQRAVRALQKAGFRVLREGKHMVMSDRLGWTRDPFDRLIVAHALLRGWRLATSDEVLLARLSEDQVLEP